ncbi:ribosomal protein S15 precursor-like protein [Ophiocordyceps camponoti-floridani]|uniref:Ribosomal protein S15-like protein n=1 Tax=Ophiocordyceps camponoti-floridani TaxID=2030778 RepID=A0A8H4Q3Y6_9HYPO|nr:ribosomal protein S15 precursor-like protein [Ophiocordyceps camponoti-floridani]
MPPRIGALQRLSTVKLFDPCTAARLLPVVQAASISKREKAEKLKNLRKLDPYRREQAEQRKKAHVERQEILKQQRAAEWGHPVWGAPTPTPFVESLVSGGQQAFSVVVKEEAASEDGDESDGAATGEEGSDAVVSSSSSSSSSSEARADAVSNSSSPGGEAGSGSESVNTADAEDGAASEPQEVRELPTSFHLRNHYVTEQEFEETIKYAYELTKPKESVIKQALFQPYDHPPDPQERSHDENHERAKLAMQRILAIEHASGKNVFHINVERILEKFGRHETDKFLPPKPAGTTQRREPAPRGGPDTGSSEVQIAILTAKIRKLATMLQSKESRKDKHNRRRLRLLVHRRQKLLRYLKKRERGGGRWTHLIEELGLTPATWEGEITI